MSGGSTKGTGKLEKTKLDDPTTQNPKKKKQNPKQQKKTKKTEKTKLHL